MASQGERELGVLGMDEGVLESIAQDGDPEQEMLVVQEQELPQTNSEPEMGTVAAASDTPPSPLRQSPSPLPSEATTDRGDSASSGSAEISQVGEMFARMLQKMEGMGNEIKGINSKMDTNVKEIKEEMNGMNNKMEANTNKMEEMRGETQNMGVSLKGSLDELKKEMKKEVDTIRAEVTG